MWAMHIEHTDTLRLPYMIDVHIKIIYSFFEDWYWNLNGIPVSDTQKRTACMQGIILKFVCV
jgi:hypothetical protein